MSSDPLPQQVGTAALGGDAHIDTKAQQHPLGELGDEKGEGARARAGGLGQGNAKSTTPPTPFGKRNTHRERSPRQPQSSPYLQRKNTTAGL